MLDQKKFQRVGDIVCEIVGPILICLMVISLAFFLLEVLHGREHVQTLKWKFGCFSIAAVLISRISIQIGYHRAWVYGCVLAIAILLVSSRFISIWGAGVIVATIWWVAARLVWDATFIDDTRDSSNQGIVQLSSSRFQRWFGRLMALREADASEPPASTIGQARRAQADNVEPQPPHARLIALLFGRRRPNRPGLWVFYFLLLGLPIFGLGQGLISGRNVEGQRLAPFYFGIYTGSGLLLLMMTSLLGMSRYLQQRRATVGMTVLRSWLVTGVIIAVGVLFVAFWLPRPTAQFSIAGWVPKIQSKLREASSGWLSGSEQSQEEAATPAGPGSRSSQNRGAGSGDQGGRGDDQDSGQSSSDGQQGAQVPDPQGQHSGGKQSASSKQNSGGRGSTQGNGPSSSKQKNNSRQSKSSSGKPSPQKKSAGDASPADRNDDSGERPDNPRTKPQPAGEDGSQQRDNPATDQQPDRADQSGATPAPQKNNSPDEPTGDRERQTDSSTRQPTRSSGSGPIIPPSARRNRSSGENRFESQSGENSKQESESSSNSQTNSPQSDWSVIGLFIKFLLWAILIVAAIVLAVKYRHQIQEAWQSFLNDVRKFLEKLFGPRESGAEPGSGAVQTETTRLDCPFSSYQNPFNEHGGTIRDPGQVVQYTFAALEAWAREQGSPRDSEATPQEFCADIATRFPRMRRSSELLADLYNSLAYAQGGIRREEVRGLARLWKQMSESTPPMPPSDLMPAAN